MLIYPKTQCLTPIFVMKLDAYYMITVKTLTLIQFSFSNSLIDISKNLARSTATTSSWGQSVFSWLMLRR